MLAKLLSIPSSPEEGDPPADVMLCIRNDANVGQYIVYRKLDRLWGAMRYRKPGGFVRWYLDRAAEIVRNGRYRSVFVQPCSTSLPTGALRQLGMPWLRKIHDFLPRVPIGVSGGAAAAVAMHDRGKILVDRALQVKRVRLEELELRSLMSRMRHPVSAEEMPSYRILLTIPEHLVRVYQRIRTGIIPGPLGGYPSVGLKARNVPGASILAGLGISI